MIIIVGPNTGSYLGAGGGVRVALNMAEILADAGIEVALVAAEGLTINELDALHGTNLTRHQRKGLVKLWYYLGNHSPHIPFPLKVRLLSLYLAGKISKGGVDLVIFHDDVPKPPVADQWPCRAILYAHFPYMARLFFNVSDPSEEKASVSVIKDRIVRIAMKESIFIKERPKALLLANSSITRAFMNRVWGSGIDVLYPPVFLQKSIPKHEKTDLVTVISAIQPNKRIGDILTAISLSKRGRLMVIGRVYHGWYHEWLMKRVRDLGIEGRVEIITDANDTRKFTILDQSKIILSSSHFEPFGISVVEGMSRGCVPIVYGGDLSGPWVDICERGRFGLGYLDTGDLAMKIDRILSKTEIWQDYSHKAIARANAFSFESFRGKWLEQVGKTLGC